MEIASHHFQPGAENEDETLIGSNSRADASDYTVEGGILTHYNGAGGDVNDIPSGVETIAASAFENNQKITSITIPSNVKTVESSAFMGCQNLQSVDMSSSAVTVIPANCGLCRLNN